MSGSHDISSRPDRRNVVLAGATLLGAAAVPIAFPLAAEAGLAPAAEFLARTNQFLSSLEPQQRQAASFAWNGPEWLGWNYFGSSDFIKPGLRLEQMTARQKAAAWEILATILSPSGLEKAKNVMTLQDVLASLGNGAGKRSSERFSFAVFLVTLEAEEALARKLYGDLAPKLQTKARLSDTPLSNILSYSGHERANAQ